MNENQALAEERSPWVDAVAAGVRAAFGLAWAIDAYLKWQPAFADNYLKYITGVVSGQPAWLLPWYNLWVGLVTPHPLVFAWLTRLAETVIALGLLFGIGRKWIYLLGGVFAALIWSIPEGFGGPYAPGSTDVGAGLIYVLLFVGLIVMDRGLGRSPYSLDYYLEKLSPAWNGVGEWATSQMLQREPHRLSWKIQIPILLGIVILLTIFLIIIHSELVANASSSFLPAPILRVARLLLWRG
jgi:nitrite reductase (NO-forming)